MKKKRNGIILLVMALKLPAMLVCVFTLAGCPQPAQSNLRVDGKETESITGAQTPNLPFAPAAFLFKLEGGTDVNNVKLIWAKQDGCVLYEVYRDGTLAGKVTGARFDDYGLSPGNHSYTVKAYTGVIYHGATVPGSILNEASLRLKAESSAVSVSPFTPGPVTDTKDNTDITDADYINTGTEPEGFEIGNARYKYAVTGSGGTLTVTEYKSADNGSTWDGGRTIATIKNSKLEGQSWNKVGDKISFNAHHENNTDYVMSNFFLATITPGTGDATTWKLVSNAGGTGTLEHDGTMPGSPAFVVNFCERPFGYPSRDHRTYLDETSGKAYLLSANNGDTNIYEINSDWTGLAGDGPVNIVMKGDFRETPFIVRHGGYYFLFSSKQNGWYPSQTKYAYATSLDGTWSDLIDVGNAATGSAQFNNVGKYGNTYGITAYRWAAQYDHNKESRNSTKLLPLAFNGTFAAAAYFNKVEYLPPYGLVGVQPGRILTQGLGTKVTVSSVSTADNKAYVNTFSITDGEEMESSGQFRGDALPYSIDIDLGAPAVLKGLHLTTRLVAGSDSTFKYTVEGSGDGETYDNVLTNSGWELGHKVDTITGTNPYRYVRFTLTGIQNVRQSSNPAAAWADGIIELAIFGIPEN
jgi:hypothetical protein